LKEVPSLETNSQLPYRESFFPAIPAEVWGDRLTDAVREAFFEKLNHREVTE
jgi:hypothetical protein